MIEFVDIVVDLAYGDCGKGSIAYLLSSRDDYDVVMRTSGGSNAGHTIFHNGVKVVTHLIPSGVFFGKTSVIGNGCVINKKKFFEEINYLNSLGIDTSKVKIAHNCHVVTDEHIEEETFESTVGTTKQGIGPAYRDKYARIGKLAHEIPEFLGMIVNLKDFFYSADNIRILVEGAQGFYLDVDYGHYPYVTSSHPTVAGSLLNYIPHNKIRNVYGVIKAYDTYVGSMNFSKIYNKDIVRSRKGLVNDDMFKQHVAKLTELGQEYGSTTGRQRQVDYVNLSDAFFAAQVNCVTHLIITKCDIAESVFGNLSSTPYYDNHLGVLTLLRGEGYHGDFVESVWRMVKKLDAQVTFRRSSTEKLIFSGYMKK